MFKLDANGVTDVIEGADGTYRIGRVTEIAPAQVDAAWDQKLADGEDQPRTPTAAAIRSEAIRQALEDKVVADDSDERPAAQRLGALHPGRRQTTPAPRRSRSATSCTRRRTIRRTPRRCRPATRPGPRPSSQAQATYDALVKDPSKFDAIARKDSDETSAKGDDGTGGKLPYFDETSEANGLDPDFAKAILADGLQPGQILPPFKSAFGWHVVQVMYRPPDRRPDGQAEEAGHGRDRRSATSSATTPRARSPARAATSAGSPTASSTTA